MKLTRYHPEIGAICTQLEYGEYVLATEAQAQIDLLRTALEDIANMLRTEPRIEAIERARTALEQTKP